MKKVINLVLICFLIALTSCKESNKEDIKSSQEVEIIETIEKEVDSITNTIEKEAQEVEDALKELDSI